MGDSWKNRCTVWMHGVALLFLVAWHGMGNAAAPQAQASATSATSATYVAVPGNIFSSLNKGAPSGVFIQATDAILRQMGKTPGYVSIPTTAALQSLEQVKMCGYLIRC